MSIIQQSVDFKIAKVVMRDSPVFKCGESMLELTVHRMNPKALNRTRCETIFMTFVSLFQRLLLCPQIRYFGGMIFLKTKFCSCQGLARWLLETLGLGKISLKISKVTLFIGCKTAQFQSLKSRSRPPIPLPSEGQGIHWLQQPGLQIVFLSWKPKL